MKFTIREMVDQDIDAIYQLMKYPHIVRLVDQPVASYDRFEERYKRYTNGQMVDQKIFVILLDDVVIGKMELGFDLTHKTGRFEIIIGNKQFWGTGIAVKAFEVLCSYAFNNLSLNKLSCEVLAYNERGLGFMRKMGMTMDGVLRAERMVDHQFTDVYVFSLLRDDLEGEM